MKTYDSISKTVCKAIPAMLLGFALIFSTGQVASAQILNDITRRAKNAAETRIKMGADRAVHKTLDKAEKAVEKSVKNAADNSSAKKSKSSTSNVPEGRSGGAKASNGSTWYVSATGSNKNDGRSPETPYKNVQKALDEAADGDVVCVAAGNYTGTLDQGFIDITKYVSLVGGYNEDFSERDPYVHKTYIQTNPSHVSKNGSKAAINIEVSGSRAKTVMVDGFSVDMGEQSLYCAADPTDPVSGTPEGCLTGRKLMVGESPSTAKVGGAAQERRAIHGHVEGHLVIRNCVIANATFYGIQIMNKGGNWEIYNNVFVANCFASCQIDSMTKDANECFVDFHHNTVLFSWCRTKVMEDMGYGYRFMSRVDSDVHDNIFGCSNLGAIDFAHHDSDKAVDAKRKLNIIDNQFFMNVADMIIPSQSYMWLYVKCDEFEDVEGINESGNVELTDQNFVSKINQPYLRGFANLEKVESSSYNPNSAANQVRRAFGVNQQGTETVRVTMFANKYPFDEAYNLFGALEGCGAQIL